VLILTLVKGERIQIGADLFVQYVYTLSDGSIRVLVYQAGKERDGYNLRRDQRVLIRDGITITYVGSKSSQRASIGVHAPKEVPVDRESIRRKKEGVAS